MGVVPSISRVAANSIEDGDEKASLTGAHTADTDWQDPGVGEKGTLLTVKSAGSTVGMAVKCSWHPLAVGRRIRKQGEERPAAPPGHRREACVRLGPRTHARGCDPRGQGGDSKNRRRRAACGPEGHPPVL